MAKRKRYFADNPKEASRRYRIADRQATVDTLTQFVGDCCLLALHDKFGFGEERLTKFNEAFNEALVEWWEVVASPKPGDKSSEVGYKRTKFDAALKRCCGSKYTPFEERYKWLDNGVI